MTADVDSAAERGALPAGGRPVNRRRLLLRGAPLAVLLIAAVVFLALGGWGRTDPGSDTVRVATPLPDAETSRTCAKLIDALPRTVAGAERRKTEPSPRLTAAWGDPAIVLRCGVVRPDEMNNPFATGGKIGGVEWMLESPQDDGRHRCTTALRKIYVEVSIPGTYQDVQPLADLSEAIRTVVPAGISNQ